MNQGPNPNRKKMECSNCHVLMQANHASTFPSVADRLPLVAQAANRTFLRLFQQFFLQGE
jgi:hypothetical protein